jgi:uncharacterized protein YjeT (DUF2065 family)
MGDLWLTLIGIISMGIGVYLMGYPKPQKHLSKLTQNEKNIRIVGTILFIAGLYTIFFL